MAEELNFVDSLPLLTQQNVVRRICLGNGQSTMDGVHDEHNSSNDDLLFTLDGHAESVGIHLPGSTDEQPTRRLFPFSLMSGAKIQDTKDGGNSSPDHESVSKCHKNKDGSKPGKQNKPEFRRQRSCDCFKDCAPDVALSKDKGESNFDIPKSQPDDAEKTKSGRIPKNTEPRSPSKGQKTRDESNSDDSKPLSGSKGRRLKDDHKSDAKPQDPSKGPKNTDGSEPDNSKSQPQIKGNNRKSKDARKSKHGEPQSNSTDHIPKDENTSKVEHQTNPYSCDCFTQLPPLNPTPPTLPPSHQLPNGHFPPQIIFYKHKRDDLSIGNRRGDPYLYVKTYCGKDEPWFALLSGRDSKAPPLATIERPGQSITSVQADIRPPLMSKGDKKWMKINAPRFSNGQSIRPEWWRSGQLEIFKEHKEAKSFEFEAHVPSTDNRERFQWQNCRIEGIEGLHDGLGKRLMRAETREVVAGWAPSKAGKQHGEMVFLGAWKELGQDFEVMSVVGILISMLAPIDSCGTRCPNGNCPPTG